MEPVVSVEDALAQLDAYEGEAAGFKLVVAESLLDPVGVNRAIITDRVLARGWMPDGFEQGDGCRIYAYTE